jgi:hypothetical protein
MKELQLKVSPVAPPRTFDGEANIAKVVIGKLAQEFWNRRRRAIRFGGDLPRISATA